MLASRPARQQLTEKQKISKFYRTVSKFTLAKKACEEWDAKPEADKTWTNIQKHFRDWYDLKMADTTTEEAGHHGANLATTDAVPSRADLLLADATEALKTNQAMMANLAKKNDEKDAMQSFLSTRSRKLQLPLFTCLDL